MPLNAAEQEVMDGLTARRPDLEACTGELLRAHEALVASQDAGGILYACGNGGSHADAVHIVGELCKSFERRRPLSPALRGALAPLPFGDALAENLETGLRAHTLGCNSALKTAIENDNPLRDIAFAQELNALVRPQDVLLAISTSGQAANCRMAISVARAHGAASIALTGPDGGPMAREAALAIRAPGVGTKEIQESHIVLWHTLCCLLEAHYFPEPRQ